MMSLELFSEPFARTGNISAEGFRNLLGRPTLGLTKTVIRESFQNSIDAARRNTAPNILLRVRVLGEEEREALARRVLASLPADAVSRKSISDSLEKPDLRVMEIADFGTTGLAGPTRADMPSDSPDEADFVNFMRNVGAARDVHQGGGTYGYGKTSLYAMSACSTIVVDSETISAGQPVRRVMACHLGAAHDANLESGERRRYTGRHWWGVGDGEGGVDPAEHELAVELARSLGMPERDRGSTGTSIMIVDPLLFDDEDGSIADDLLETVMWNFWPRMADTTPPLRKLAFRLEVDGEDVPVPRPEEYPPLDLFAAALKDLREGAEGLKPIASQRPARHLGKLAMKKGMCGARTAGALRSGSIIPRQSCHIALMRPVELVVRYVEGEPFADSRFEWAGVFVCSDDDEVEQAFARAEPPAHDDWIPENMPKGPAKTFVRVALREVVSIARNHAIPAGTAAQAAERGPSLAATATRMGRLLDQTQGNGPGRRKGSSSPSARKTLALSQPRFMRLEADESSRPVAIFAATLTNDGSVPDLRVVAEPHLVMDGGAAGTDGLPSGYSTRVSSMQMKSRKLHSDDEELCVGELGGEIEIAVPMPSEAAVGLRLSLREGEAG
ncbi:hypothetical protein [Oricola sp.]|uniref:hypothetical protein n=1 Tax=Oricola sp. TaxID=1979950 RepID=UPI00351311E3